MGINMTFEEFWESEEMAEVRKFGETTFTELALNYAKLLAKACWLKGHSQCTKKTIAFVKSLKDQKAGKK
jgi:hypothetical protein